MKQSLVDQYSGLDSLIHRLDPRTKLLSTLAFILLVVAIPPSKWQSFALAFLAIATLILLSRLPIGYVLKRSLVIVPFVLVIAMFIPFFKQGEVAGSYNIWMWRVSVTYSGLLVLWNVVIKSWLSILSLILFSGTTPLRKVLHALEELRLPLVFVMMLSFMYRYLFVLLDEVGRMRRARDSRNFGGRHLWQIKTVGNMIGTLFIRSYERGERMYSALLARGYDGRVRTLTGLKLGRADIYFGILFACCLTLIGLTMLLQQPV